MVSNGRQLFSNVPLNRVFWVCFTFFYSIKFLYNIFHFLLGHDVIAQAQSGTGKTATFAISILQQLDMESKDCQALILAPTRELAQQVYLYIQLIFCLLTHVFYYYLDPEGSVGTW